MTGKTKRASHCRVILTITILLIIIAMFVEGVLLCGAAWFAVGLVYELEEVEDPQILVEKEVTVDPDTLPEHPTEQDWYRIAVQILEDHGWNLAPNLTSFFVRVPCQSYPEPDLLSMNFADAYFEGVVPRLKTASVSFDQNTNTGSVLIEYQALRWRHDTLDLSKTNVGLYEALEIADRYGGRDYREDVNDKCRVIISLSEHVWNISYKESGEPWSEQRILVDFRTGEAKQASR
jgi:hypothetical protein